MRKPVTKPVTKEAHDALIARYESISEASARMLDAARHGDWETLTVAEAECARLIDALQASMPLTVLALDPVRDRQRITVLQIILGHDAEIRTLTQHWLHGLEQLLRSAGLDHLARGSRPPPRAAG